MSDPAFAQGLSYLELILLLAAFALAVLLVLLWRRLFKGFVLSRAGLPAVFLMVALGLKLNFIRRSFSLSARFYDYLSAAVVFLAVLLAVRLADALIMDRYRRRQRTFPLPGVLHAFLLIVVYLTVLFAVLKGILGINISPLLATSAIFTAILGLAFQGVLSNVLAGISLNLTKSVNRGDWVKIGPHEGVVQETNWRETLVLDRAGNIIVIPNNAVASEMIVNFSQPDTKSGILFPLKVSYEAPPAAVLDILLESAREVPDVLVTPAPQSFLVSYDDLGISYLLKFWITDFARKPAISTEVGRRIWYKFKRNNIEIPIHLAERVKDVVQAVRIEDKAKTEGEERQKTYEDLLRSGLLRYREGEKAGELLVSPDEVRPLAAVVRRKTYARGEVLFRQGERGESCFIVAKGMIKGEVIYEEKGKRYKSEFRTGPGGIFGEMSLFTGLPRTATGTIEEEAELLEIKAEDFTLVLGQNPKIAEAIADLVSSRNQKNAVFLRKIKDLSEKDIEASCNRNSILERLKKLVSLFRKI